MVRPAVPTASGPWGFLFEKTMCRVSVYIDGFNLYHALDDLAAPHLKWLDLRELSERLVPAKSEHVSSVKYVSAYAHHLPEKRKRHQVYVSALAANSVLAIMGHFKKKRVECPSCGHRWMKREEKETDVNIALHMLNDAFEDVYDKLILISNDSDLKPALEMIKRRFDRKNIMVVAPPERHPSKDMQGVADEHRKLTRKTIEKCLLPGRIPCLDGGSPIIRPPEYDPPPRS